MDATAFFASLQDPQPAPGLGAPLVALWLDARGDWERAHATVQGDASPKAARVHAYLHRKENDLTNARYWYRRAGVDSPQCPLADEWRKLVMTLLAQGAGDGPLGP